MAYTVFQDQVAPETGRKYNIDVNGQTITDITQYEQQGTDITANLMQDIGILEANYAKSSTTHQITTANLSSINLRFTATASWSQGDSFTVNDSPFVLKSIMGNTVDPFTGWFAPGAIVMLFVDWANSVLYIPIDAVSYALASSAESTASANANSISVINSKLNGIESGAQKNTITGVKGNKETSYRTGNINLTPANVGAVPVDRSVNGKALSADISLAASDVGAVPTSRKVAGHALTGDVTVSKSDVGLGNVDNAKQMPIAGGTFTGPAYAQSANGTQTRLRNAIVENSSGTAQSTNYLRFRRK